MGYNVIRTRTGWNGTSAVAAQPQGAAYTCDTIVNPV
jgi:hypothetical protein